MLGSCPSLKDIFSGALKRTRKIPILDECLIGINAIFNISNPTTQLKHKSTFQRQNHFYGCCGGVVFLYRKRHNHHIKSILSTVNGQRTNETKYNTIYLLLSTPVSSWKTPHSTVLPSPRIKNGRRKKDTVPLSSLCPSRSFSDCPFMRVAIVLRWWEWRTVWHPPPHRPWHPCASVNIPSPAVIHARPILIVCLIFFVLSASRGNANYPIDS